MLCEIPKRRARMRTDNSLRFLNGCHLPQRNVSTLPTQIRGIHVFGRLKSVDSDDYQPDRDGAARNLSKTSLIRSGVSFFTFSRLERRTDGLKNLVNQIENDLDRDTLLP